MRALGPGIFALVLILGCGGGGSAPSAPPPATSSPPPSATSPAKKTDIGSLAAKPPAKQSTPAPASEIPPDTLLVGGNQPNFLVLSVADSPLENRFLVQTPQVGLDSTFVSLEVPPVDPPPANVARLPEGFEAIPDAGFDSNGQPLRIRCAKDGGEMVLIAAGPFLQGIDGAAPEAEPQHVIDLDAYYIDVHEVTVRQFQMFREAMKADDKAVPDAQNSGSSGDHPVLGANWRSATLYGRWAGKTLPTEAEWEKAARGTEGYQFPWGNGRVIWESRRELGQIEPVGSHDLDRSVYGVLDLAGNAREWCTDWYAADAYHQLGKTPGVSLKNWPGPKTADKASERVVKSGQDRWEVWSRVGVPMGDAPADVGFRCVLRLSDVPAEASEDEPATPRASRNRPPESRSQPPKSAPPRPKNNPGF